MVRFFGTAILGVLLSYGLMACDNGEKILKFECEDQFQGEACFKLGKAREGDEALKYYRMGCEKQSTNACTAWKAACEGKSDGACAPVQAPGTK